MVQIGLRASGYEADDFDWPREQGVRVVQAEECWYQSLKPLMEEVRAQLGAGPVYDTSGNTALVATNLLFEMLCVFPGVQYRS